MIRIHMYLISSAQRKSYSSPWRLFVHGAVWQALLSTCYALQTSHMDQRTHQHTRDIWPRFCCLTEGEKHGHSCIHTQTSVSLLPLIHMLSVYSSFLVLPGEEAEAGVDSLILGSTDISPVFNFTIWDKTVQPRSLCNFNNPRNWMCSNKRKYWKIIRGPL